MIDKSKETVALFLRENDTPETSLVEMQCSWYDILSGDSCLRQAAGAGDKSLLENALVQFSHVAKYFRDIVDDQFDFHA